MPLRQTAPWSPICRSLAAVTRASRSPARYEPGTHGTATRGYQFGPLVYLAITATAFVSPLVAVVLFLAYAVYWVLPTGSPSAGAAA